MLETLSIITAHADLIKNALIKACQLGVVDYSRACPKLQQQPIRCCWYKQQGKELGLFNSSYRNSYLYIKQLETPGQLYQNNCATESIEQYGIWIGK